MVGAAANVGAPLSTQVDPPPGIDKVTEPPGVVPVPVTVSGAKFAVTVCAALMVTVQLVALPVQAPLQPMKTLFEAGVAFSTTVAACA